MNKESLKTYLSDRYQGWDSFLDNVIFPVFGEDDFEDGYEAELLDSQPERRQLANSTGIRSIKQIGKMYVGVEPLQIFDVTVSSHVMVERNRVNIQKLIRTVMDQFSCAFMLFHYQDNTRWDWRFTFCRKGATNTDGTDNKRYTFPLGPGQSCKTAADNFMTLYDHRENLEIKDIESAFDVEALSKEFFDKYKGFYEDFVAYVTGKRYVKRSGKWVNTVIHEPHPQMYADFGKLAVDGDTDKLVRDYIKKMMGRIVFLHFLQKKGWMGVPSNKNWGEGNLQFMKDLFDKATDAQKDDFLDVVLEPLFSALDEDRAKDDYLYDTITLGKLKVPYLNGGLFTRDKLDDVDTKFPAEMFENFLKCLYEYNFTIDENDPSDAQVGIDPEMLGRIFENLLEDNKDKGAYYTPKEIVKYMCQESLKSYLQTDVEDDAKKEQISKFVETYDVNYIGGEDSELATMLDERLKEVEICDPAIGSGAFPMGLLKELFFCRGAIEHFDNAADIKRHIIQNNIYGVDLERGAVDIARLRFWLSLIIDEETPETLPNLDFKIMQGNSLLEQYEGADLSKLAQSKIEIEKGHGLQLSLYDNMVHIHRFQLQKLIDEYYNCTDHDWKDEILDEIADKIKDQIEDQAINVDFGDIDFHETDKFFLWHTWFKDVFSRPSKQGFDIVIGNPPYGAKTSANDKAIFKRTYSCAKTIAGEQKGSTDTYAVFTNLGYDLLCKNGSLAYIVPMGIISSDAMTALHNLLMNNCNKFSISSYSNRPQQIFDAACVRTSIVMFRKTLTPMRFAMTTKLMRRSKGMDIAQIIDNLHFVNSLDLKLRGRFAKIGSQEEYEALSTLFTSGKNVSHYEDENSDDMVYYRAAGGRYFNVVTNYQTHSSAERSILVQNGKSALIACILSSSVFWFYQQVYTDGLNLKSYEIDNFPIPDLDTLSETRKKEVEDLYSQYIEDIENKATIQNASASSSYHITQLKVYKLRKSKAIIDKIDDLICPLYGLSPEETEFIKNYEIEFRLSDDE